MNDPATKDYRENREAIPFEELRRHSDQWVAFNSDGSRILAGASTIVELAARLEAMQIALKEVVLEHIDFDTAEVNLGAAEWQ